MAELSGRGPSYAEHHVAGRLATNPFADTRTWVPTRAMGRAVVVTAFLAVVAVILGRYDLVVLAAPFALGAAWGLRTRPARLPELTLASTEDPVVEGHEIAARVVVANTDECAYDAVIVRAAPSRWVRLRHSDRPYVGDLPPGAATAVDLAGPALRWGEHWVGPAQAFAVAGGGLLISTPTFTDVAPVKVFPAVDEFRADDAMPHAAGLVGVHRSRRPGEGGELAGIRAFAPGDRLRRIDWRTTLRAQHPYVAQTLSDRDAEVALVLDVVHEAGRSGGIHGPASALDTTVRAATAIAQHYLHRGDRVSLIEYGYAVRRLRAGTGRRHFHAVLEWILQVRPSDGVETPPPYLFDGHHLPTRGLVVVLTPLLNEHSAEMVARLARSGRMVVAIDTLDAAAATPYQRSAWGPLAHRLWWMDRENVIGQLREVGVPVAEWAGTGSLDHVLRDVTQLAAAPRVGAR